jgi:hypothetical protein
MKKLGLILVAMLMLAALCSCAHTHDYKEEVTAPTCTTNGYTTFTCECGDVYYGNMVPAGHKEEVTAGKDATCTEEGLTEGKKCAGCGGIYQIQKPIPAKGHQYGDWTVVKEPTKTEKGSKERVCATCGGKDTQEIASLADRYTVTYDLNGGLFAGGYTSIDALADAFLADFNKYGDGSVVTKEGFQGDSHPCVKTSLANAEMLAKWKWLWVAMLNHLKATNPDSTSAYLTDAYPILERMINGDTAAIDESSNARTTIRSYIHGFMNAMKGCGDINSTFSKFSPDFSSESEQMKLLAQQYELTVTLEYGAKLAEPTREGYRFAGWKNEEGQIVTTVTGGGVLVAVWEK